MFAQGKAVVRSAGISPKLPARRKLPRPHGSGAGRHSHGSGAKSPPRRRAERAGAPPRGWGKILPTMAGRERAAAARFRHPRPHGQGREGTPTAVVRNHPTAERRREHTPRRGDGQKNKSTLSSAFFLFTGLYSPAFYISNNFAVTPFMELRVSRSLSISSLSGTSSRIIRPWSEQTLPAS